MIELSKGLVSIIIPSYNHRDFIKSAVLSVIKQSYSNIELIVIDDGSTDDSYQILKELSRIYGFKLIKQQNIGLTATLNKGMSIAKGDYISFCSSDDQLHEEKIKLQVECLEDNLDSSFCFTRSYVFDDNDRILKKATALYNHKLCNDIGFEDVFTFKVSLPVTGMYRTEFIRDALGGFDESLTAEDYDINLRVIINTKIVFVNRKLYYYRTPAAIGRKRTRPVMRLDVSESHFRTLSKYKEHKLYKEALLAWNYRRFIFFSAYSRTKLYALAGMVKSLKKANDIYFYKAIFRLVFYWKNY